MGSGSSASKNSFIWGHSGTVQIKNSRFKAAYNSDTKSIDVLYPKNLVTISELSWKGRTFTLQDKVSIDFSTQLSYTLPENKFVFKVNKNDNFVKVENLDELITKVSRDQGKAIDSEKRKILINKFTRECKEFWDLARGFWLRGDFSETDVTQYNIPCVRVQAVKDHDKAALEKVARKQFNVIEMYDIRKELNVRGFFEIANLRPFTVSLQKSNLLRAGTTEGIVFHFERELRTMLFCWDDIQDLNSFDALKYEMNNIERGIQSIMKEMDDEVRAAR